MTRYAEIILSHREKNDGTAFPIWAVCVKAGLGNIAWLAGPWFSRERATEHMKNAAHRYPKTAFVWCFSGHMSNELREMYELARAEHTPESEEVHQ